MVNLEKLIKIKDEFQIKNLTSVVIDYMLIEKVLFDKGYKNNILQNKTIEYLNKQYNMEYKK